MSVIYLLITISIFVAIAFLIAFFMAVKSGQYDDDYTPSVRMLFDDETARTQSRNHKAKSVNQNTTTNSEKE
ncbi:cytochrome oxidase maturation protein, cbb3-type [Flavobacterium sp. L1I52]|uniref:Cytochrome oxidase maturation protein, cbb3-type n=1 Tax=Flavobacterium pokkalii TaxID=1940408 RepID=A0ABR7UTD6_9FLAO|nr:cbb3-type cytochrome oxidase assembly protein CcoS [Flavobacterium pokkalii]MBD0726180.1 cytochrome oxidase maturation protein, cbb3-type [Flavobacterium pokkalii]